MRKKQNVKILYEDDHMIVCVKPYGMPSQSDKTKDLDLVRYLKNYLYEKSDEDGEPYIALVHRLDRPVGGVMVVAKTELCARELSNQIQQGKMEKDYQCILTGTLPEEQGLLTDYLLKDGKTNTSKVVSKDTKNAKKAELEYEVFDCIETKEGEMSLVCVHLLTGRHHQIRVQMAKHGVGVYGDTKYNQKFQKVKKEYQQIGLFSTRLAFYHPVTKEKMVWKEEPYGEVFEQFDAME